MTPTDETLRQRRLRAMAQAERDYRRNLRILGLVVGVILLATLAVFAKAGGVW